MLLLFSCQHDIGLEIDDPRPFTTNAQMPHLSKQHVMFLFHMRYIMYCQQLFCNYTRSTFYTFEHDSVQNT